MSDAKQLMERAIKAWNGRDLDGFVGLASSDARIAASGGVQLTGPESMQKFYLLWRTACPDNAVTFHNIVGEGDPAIGERTLTGTHYVPLHAPAGDIPPNGMRVNADFAAAHRTADGRVTSLRIYFDVLDLMTQLGLAAGPDYQSGGD